MPARRFAPGTSSGNSVHHSIGHQASRRCCVVGPLFAVGRADTADETVAAMRAAGYAVRETGPFAAAELRDAVARPAPSLTPASAS